MCLAPFWLKGLWLCCATLQHLFPSFPWIAPLLSNPGQSKERKESNSAIWQPGITGHTGRKDGWKEGRKDGRKEGREQELVCSGKVKAASEREVGGANELWSEARRGHIIMASVRRLVCRSRETAAWEGRSRVKKRGSRRGWKGGGCPERNMGYDLRVFFYYQYQHSLSVPILLQPNFVPLRWDLCIRWQQRRRNSCRDRMSRLFEVLKVNTPTQRVGGWVYVVRPSVRPSRTPTRSFFTHPSNFHMRSSNLPSLRTVFKPLTSNRSRALLPHLLPSLLPSTAGGARAKIGIGGETLVQCSPLLRSMFCLRQIDLMSGLNIYTG